MLQNHENQITILLADDNPAFLAAVWSCLYLLPKARIVAEARDGEEALAKAMKLQPDLVLLDIAMPKLNGLEVARIMQAWAHPPRIVFLSMNDSQAYLTAAHELGVFGFVAKSDFVTELLPIIELFVAAKANTRQAVP